MSVKKAKPMKRVATVKTKTAKSKINTKANTKANTKIKKSVNTKKSANVSVKVKKVSPKSKMTIYRDKQTRIEILQALAEETHLSKKQVETLFDELNKLIAGHLKKRGSGEFIIPKTGIKIRRIKKKASKARTMFSPLTGKETVIAAKPSRAAVKLTGLKVLQALVE